MIKNLKYLLLLFAAPCWGGILTVNLNPLDGALTGTPGGAVVWGVQVINSDASDWLFITSVEAPGYAGSGATGEIPDGANAFTDYLSVYFLNNFTTQGLALAPGQIIDRGYSSGTPTVGDPNTTGLGLASEAISSTAAAGTAPATIEVLYDVFDGDPFTTGNYLFSDETDVSTSVTVTLGASPGGPSGVPEPGQWLTVTGVLALFGWRALTYRNASGKR